MKSPRKQKKKKFGTDIELIFDGNEVSSNWHHPKLAKLFCALCKDEGVCKTPCVSVNPYCG